MRLAKLPIIARVAILATVLSFCASVAVLGFIYLRTRDDALIALRQQVEEESIALGQLANSDPRKVAEYIRAEVAQGDPLMVLAAFDAGGKSFAGTVPARLKPSTLAKPGFQIVALDPPASGVDGEAGIVVRPLAHRGWLVNGRFFGERLSLQRTIERSLWLALVVSLLFGMLCGALVARYVSRRVRSIAAVVDVAGAGDFGPRAPLVGSGDAFDQLSGQINLMLDRLSALMAEVRLITDSLAHDLRSPISRLRSRIEQAMAAEDGARRQQLLGGSLQEADALTRMLGTVLDIGRAEAMEGRERFAWIDPVELVAELAEMYEPLAEESSMTLTQSVEGTVLPHFLHRQLIAQALSNLADNAIGHAAMGGKLAFFVRQSENGLELGVADAGPGIAAAQREEARRRFGRLDAARSRPGAGLGLALAEAVARLHGGRLDLSDGAPGLRAAIALPMTARGMTPASDAPGLVHAV